MYYIHANKIVCLPWIIGPAFQSLLIRSNPYHFQQKAIEGFPKSDHHNDFFSQNPFLSFHAVVWGGSPRAAFLSSNLIFPECFWAISPRLVNYVLPVLDVSGWIWCPSSYEAAYVLCMPNSFLFNTNMLLAENLHISVG